MPADALGVRLMRWDEVVVEVASNLVAAAGSRH